jgi:hypothetical protein
VVPVASTLTTAISRAEVVQIQGAISRWCKGANQTVPKILEEILKQLSQGKNEATKPILPKY